MPQFPEALLLHYLDDLDSKMECMRALIENDRQVEGCFTSYNSAMARTALKKDRLLNPPVPRPPAPAPAARVQWNRTSWRRTPASSASGSRGCERSIPCLPAQRNRRLPIN